MSRAAVRWRAPALAVALAAGLLAALRPDGSADTAAAAYAAAQRLPWHLGLLAAAVLVLGAAHYLLATSALRASSGHRLGFADTLRAQLAAAAANRLVPNGLGATAVNVRYLVRAGQGRGAAVAALGALGLVGAATDAAFAAAVGTPGSPLHLPGTARQLATLAAHGVRAGRHLPWATLLVVAVLATVWVTARRRRRPGEHVGVRVVGRHVLDLLRSPRRLTVMALSSGATTATLAFAFAATVTLAAGGHAPLPLGALVVTYLVAGAVGGSLPLPAFVGATESALVAGLVAGGVPFRTALVATLVFRLATFWAPVPVGVLSGRRLRRQRLL